jgi:phage-related protein
VLAARAGFRELEEAQKVAAQTGAVLESTGGAANVTAKHVDSLATSLSRMSGVDDETIAAGENLLLTFTNIRNEVGKGNDIFDQATSAITDMSVSLGQDMKSSAIQVGKALQDPIKGVTALRRVGVAFTEAQVKQIDAMVKSGHAMDAQKLILRELNTEFGGSAKAAGETLPGQLNKAKNAFDEVAGNVVTLLVPALVKLAAITTKVSEFFQDHKTTAKALGIALAALAATLLTVGVATKVYAAAQAIARAATVAWTAVQWLLNAALTANPIGLVVVAIGALVAGLILAWKNSETFRRIVTAAFDAVKAAATFVLDFFRNNWKTIAVLISGPFAPLIALATNAFGIRSALVNAATAILDFFRNHWKTIATIISGPFAPLVALATNAFGIRSALISAFGFIVSGVSEKVGALVSLIAGLGKRLLSAIGDLSHLLYNIGIQIIQGLINGITDKLGDLWGLVGSIGGKIKSLKGPIAEDRRLLQPEGQAIIEGLIAGIQDRVPDLERLVAGIGPGISSQFNIQGQDASMPSWAKSIQAGAVAAVEGFAETGKAKDALGDNIQDFSDAAQDNFGKVADSTRLIKDAAGSVFPEVAKTLVKGARDSANPLAFLAYMLDNVSESMKALRFYAYQLRDGLRDTIGEIGTLLGGAGITANINVLKGRALGGPVTAGQAYRVGESGPEIFVPRVGGTILSNGSGGGGTEVTLNFYGTTVGTSREFQDIIRQALYDVQRRNPGTGL